MPSWSEFETAAPDLAARVRAHLDAHKFKLLATIRRDGSPRISGVETEFSDGELWTGSMPNGVKALDLRHDPRFALHNAPVAEADWTGDAKLAGVAVEVPRSGSDSHYFRLDLREVSTVGLNPERTKLVIEVWTPAGGVRTFER